MDYKTGASLQPQGALAMWLPSHHPHLHRRGPFLPVHLGVQNEAPLWGSLHAAACSLGHCVAAGNDLGQAAGGWTPCGERPSCPWLPRRPALHLPRAEGFAGTLVLQWSNCSGPKETNVAAVSTAALPTDSGTGAISPSPTEVSTALPTGMLAGLNQRQCVFWNVVTHQAFD